MLIEVDNDIRFTDHFLPPAQKGKRDRKEICTILAAVLGHGCNLGQHAECGEVQFRVAMRIRIMFLDLHVAFVIEKAVKHESRIAVGAFDGHAVEGSVIIREEGIEFESKVAEACAVGLL